MIRIHLTEKQTKQYARTLASHDKIMISCPLGDLFEVVNKPSRKGELHGNAIGKKPLYPWRQAFTGMLLMKKIITQLKENTV